MTAALHDDPHPFTPAAGIGPCRRPRSARARRRKEKGPREAGLLHRAKIEGTENEYQEGSAQGKMSPGHSLTRREALDQRQSRKTNIVAETSVMAERSSMEEYPSMMT
jgi:hypothetical protein